MVFTNIPKVMSMSILNPSLRVQSWLPSTGIFSNWSLIKIQGNKKKAVLKQMSETLDEIKALSVKLLKISCVHILHINTFNFHLLSLKFPKNVSTLLCLTVRGGRSKLHFRTSFTTHFTLLCLIFIKVWLKNYPPPF